MLKARAASCATGQFPARGPGPITSLGTALPDPHQHGRVDAGQHPPDRRGRGDRPGWAVQALMVGQGLDVADRDRSVGDRDRDIDQDPARVVAGAALPQPIGGLAQQRR